MSFKVVFTKSYDKLERAFLKKHPDLWGRYHKTLKSLESNPFHPGLRLHALHDQYKGYYSVSINMRYRMTVDLLIQGREIILMNIGDHNEVYR